ncbi:TPA: class I SAM-dependent DNA methyltransferase [Corynebacterium striatum]|nr:class I SAM-dependent DNA methyltransferase [Corynebacterium striatum]
MAEMTHVQRVSAARDFAARWKDRGAEKSDTQQFWIDLCSNVLGMEDQTTALHFESRTTGAGWIDVVVPDAKTFIEQKSLGIDMDKPEPRQGSMVTPYQQAKRYADQQRNSKRPDYIVICNFDEFRIHNLDDDFPETEYESFKLEELPEQLHLLDFLVDPQAQRARREQKASLQAGELIGKLYKLLREQYVDPDSAASQHALNVLCVRLVFCLFAEDAGIFPKNAVLNYLAPVNAPAMRLALKRLFKQLDTPMDLRDPYDEQELAVIPYVNGGLFTDADIEIPNFTDEIRELLISELSADTDWSQISPTIFGGVFESTLNPETRHAGGMHYTSPENIHKVIDPLFLNALTDELASIINEPGVGAVKRRNNLKRYHDKLAGLTFFDPACGSGNFLTETYISLRRLENKVLSELANDQTALDFGGESSQLQVHISQFYGIEINDFAVSVAQTALWIAKLQADAETEILTSANIDNLPLRDSANIMLGNALQLDWADILEPDQCSFVIGNPPFLGARNQSKEQKAELQAAFKSIGATKNLGNIDYVGGWYAKAAEYLGDNDIRAAFVSTNSICQGEQVANVWSPLWDMGIRIDFAHDTFKWTNGAADQAAVFCVIVGFSKLGGPKTLFHYPTVTGEPEISHPKQLNAYLKDAPEVFVWNRSKPLSDVPIMGIGSQPIDDGNYLFTAEEKAEFLAAEPKAAPFFHRWYGSREFIQGVERWVMWVGDATPAQLQSLPRVRERVEAVRAYRLKSRRSQTLKAAETPQRFGTQIIATSNSLLIPEVSSQRRNYIPIGFITPENFCSNKVKLVSEATRYHFAVLHSRLHNAWMRVVGVRLKSDYSYSAGVVYNNFIWPDVTPEQEAEIAQLGQAVLEARAQYPDSTIAQMYDPDNDWMYPELTKAHAALDAAVERAYGLEPGCEEKTIVEHLFELYSQAIKKSS